MNNICLDDCKKVMLVFETVVAGIELVNCKACKVQVKESVQTISIDKCDGTQARASTLPCWSAQPD